ncbi:E3 ubiquitin-protein ligase E3D-like [Antedon mediterranea]|uniref:E3 ubiquitin-protein ligase E3D-like n=1 Tax=Antedon mediterranea TaxID=105859 RepID=UPI003AF900EB
MNVYGEIRGHIQSLQLVVCLKTKQESEFDLKISDEEIKVENGNNNWTFNLPNNIQLIPDSCHNLSWVKDEGAHMIFRIKDHAKAQDEEHSAQRSFEDALTDLECNLVCATCQSPILKSQCKFDRVCQLPSDNWQEMVEDWQCHASEDVAQIARKSLVPSTKDCFMNSTSIIVSPQVINEGVIRSSGSPVSVRNNSNKNASMFKWLTCWRCVSLIGKVSCQENDTNDWKTMSSVEIFQYSVEIRKNGVDNLLREHKQIPRLEVFLSNYLLSVSKTYMAFRFIVQSEEDSKIHALIWLINSEMKLLRSQQKANETLAKFSGKNMNNVEETSNVQCCQIVKILYEQCLGEEIVNLADEWNKDMAVHSIILPKKICFELLLLLATNTSTMPTSLQKQNNFKVGFLRLE